MKKLSFVLIFVLCFVLLTYSAYALTLEDLINYISSFLSRASEAITGSILPTRKTTTTTRPKTTTTICQGGICLPTTTTARPKTTTTTTTKPKTTTTIKKSCKDLCGDGICQRIVCFTTGCTCPETEKSCPKDCGVQTTTTTTVIVCGGLNQDCCSGDQCFSGLICDLGPGYSRKCLTDPGNYCTGKADNTQVGGNPGCQGPYRCCDEKCIFTSYEKVCPAACTDSDGGKNYYARGTTQGIYGSVIGFSTDYCTEGVTMEGHPVNLVEFYCIDDKNYNATGYFCSYGCNNGQCNPEPCVYGTADATTPVVYGTYSVYATLGSSNAWAKIVIKDSVGNVVDNLIINQDDSKDSTAAGLTIRVITVRALQDGTILGVDLGIGSMGVECLSITNCTDSDRGKDYYLKGTVTKGSISKTDQCAYCTGACPEIGECPPVYCGAVVEYFCSENEIVNTTFVCPNGCTDGACKQVTTTTTTVPSCTKECQKLGYKNGVCSASCGSGFTNIGVDGCPQPVYGTKEGIACTSITSGCVIPVHPCCCSYKEECPFECCQDDPNYLDKICPQIMCTCPLEGPCPVCPKYVCKDHNCVQETTTTTIQSKNCKDNNGVCILTVFGYGACPKGYSPADFTCPTVTIVGSITYNIAKCCVPS